MTAAEKLAVIQGGRQDADQARVELEALLDLPTVGVEIKSANVTGNGAAARIAIELSNGESMVFDSLRDMATPAALGAELAACAGALPKIDGMRAKKAVTLIRRIAQWQKTATAAEIAFDWGASFLQAAEPLHLELGDQASRWAAFKRLKDTDPWASGRFSVAAAIVLVDSDDGTRWVRSSWFHAHLREQDKTYSQQQVGARMAEVGWKRRGSSGRIKATRPGLQGKALGWSFFIVPAGWEDQA